MQARLHQNSTGLKSSSASSVDVFRDAYDEHAHSDGSDDGFPC